MNNWQDQLREHWESEQATHWLIHTIGEIAERAAEGLEPGTPLFDQLAEEVMELHLALRGKHSDTPAMEWLEIATIAVNALRDLPIGDVDTAIRTWQERHGRR